MSVISTRMFGKKIPTEIEAIVCSFLDERTLARSCAVGRQWSYGMEVQPLMKLFKKNLQFMSVKIERYSVNLDGSISEKIRYLDVALQPLSANAFNITLRANGNIVNFKCDILRPRIMDQYLSSVKLLKTFIDPRILNVPLAEEEGAQNH